MNAQYILFFEIDKTLYWP